MKQLKKYQDIAVYQLLNFSDMYLKIDGEETLVLQSPTGSGKTFMITNYIYEMSKKEDIKKMLSLLKNVDEIELDEKYAEKYVKSLNEITNKYNG